jgi:hypothetical protein
MAIRTSDKPGGFFVAFLDCLYSAGADEIRKYLKVSEEG